MTMRTKLARELLEEIAVDLDKMITGGSRRLNARRIRAVVADHLHKNDGDGRPFRRRVISEPETETELGPHASRPRIVE